MSVTRSCRDLEELHPIVRDLAVKLIEECKKQGINIGVSETYRSPERQDYLYAQGRTRPGAIITYVRGSSLSSYHQWRLAFDVYNNVRGAEYDTTILKKVGKIGQELGLEWGGAWSKFRDMPHFQYTFGLSIRDLKQGKRPPEAPKVEESVDQEYQDAVNLLLDHKIITTVEAWLPEPNTKYVDILVSRIATKVMEKDNYEDQVAYLQEVGIINSPTTWLEEDYSETDVKWLIKKSVKYL